MVDDGIDEVEEPRMRSDLVDACLILARGGQEHFVLGHISARLPGGDTFWMKPEGLGFTEVTMEDIILANLDGEKLQGKRAMHMEWPIHAEIYRARPDVKAVIHTHSRNAGAFVAADAEFQMVSQDSVLFVDGIGRFDDPRLVVTKKHGKDLADALGGFCAVAMRNHGLTIAAESLHSAVVLAISFDRSLEIQRMAAGLGSIVAMTDAEAHEMAADFAAMGHGRTESIYGWLRRQAAARTSSGLS